VALRRSCLRQGALDAGEANFTEDGGVAKLLCNSCGCVARFDGETVGIRKTWN
jgi:hypothetical protein